MTIEHPKALIMSLPPKPGIYRMLGAKGEVLYVGKARNLRKRVQSYFRANGLAARVMLLMQQAQNIEITVTHTETEALLLEINLIKTLHPRFNILLRDDKSYPYIFVSDNQEYPRIGFHRGAKREKGRYFGPYPSAFPYARRSTCCRKSSACASVMTASSATARGPACNTRSSAAPAPASA
jgi:excinuclease ABC subunit C